jgi:polyhydroxybutyrate depolymerase
MIPNKVYNDALGPRDKLPRRPLWAAILLVLIIGLVMVRRAQLMSRTPDTDLGPGVYDQSIEVDGLRRTYRLVIPQGYDRLRHAPLVLAFHGRLGTGRIMEEMTHFSKLADREGFIVVYPDGVGRSWNAGHGTGAAEQRQVDDVGFVSKLIDELASAYRIDRRRIYATGMSNGAIFALRLACELSAKITAVAVVAGTLAPAIAKDCHPRRPIPIMLVHGTEDRYVPWEGGVTGGGGRVESVEATIRLWVTINQCSPNPKVEDLGGKVRRLTYAPSHPGGPEVILYRIDGGGHTWPGGSELLPRKMVGETNRDVDASECIWNFFKKSELNEPSMEGQPVHGAVSQ